MKNRAVAENSKASNFLIKATPFSSDRLFHFFPDIFDFGMEEAVNELLKQAEVKKQEMKMSLEALSAQSSALLEVSVRLKVVDAYFDSVFQMIEKKKEEAVSEIRVREDAIRVREEESRVREEECRVREEEIRVWEERLRANRSEMFDEMHKRKKGLNKWEWEWEVERRENWVVEREKGVEVRREEVEGRREELRLREERVEALRSAIFGEICRKKMELDEREKEIQVRETRADEMERGNEVRAMELDEERTRIAKKFDDRSKETEWRRKRLDQKKKEMDVKMKEVEHRRLNLKKEKKAVERQAAKLEIKGKEMENEHCKMKRALTCLAEELERTTDENNALREELSLLTQKVESVAKSSGSSGPLREDGSVATHLGAAEVLSTSNADAATTLDGNNLQMYINDMASNDESWQDEVQTILQKLTDPAKTTCSQVAHS